MAWAWGNAEKISGRGSKKISEGQRKKLRMQLPNPTKRRGRR